MDFIEIEGTTDEKLQKLNELNIKNEELKDEILKEIDMRLD